MRVTIIADDRMVYVEGQPETVDLSSLPEDVHAVQWYGTRGEVEFKNNFVENKRKPNEEIKDFAEYQEFVDLWMIEAQRDAS